MEAYPAEMPWVIFLLMDQQFAVSTQYVKEMVAMPKVVSVPETPLHIRGVINLRGQVIPVIDLRMSMGMKSRTVEITELVELLEQREQDHKNWIAELEASVREKREFKLATNPHQCAFGKWYDRFETDNQTLSSCLKKFDGPHKKIHSIAVETKNLEKAGAFDAAYALIDRTRDNELSVMIKLFAETRHLLQDTVREIALVLEGGGRTIAAGVDSVETIERLKETNIDDVPEVIRTVDNEAIYGTGKREKDKGLVLLIDADKMLNEQTPALNDLGERVGED